MNLLELSKDLLDGSAMWVDHAQDLPFKATAHDGDPRVMVVVGENCSGKSFFVECLRSWASHDKVLNICISIRERTGAGTYEMSSFRRSMMFGDESVHSTGATSVGVLERAFDNMQGRHDEGKSCLLVLDEPEIGLSDGYAAALGTWLADKARALPESSPGVAIVTHSRALVTALQTQMGASPSMVRMGAEGNLADWLTNPEVRSIPELLALAETDITRFRKVIGVQNAIRKESEAREERERTSEREQRNATKKSRSSPKST